MKDLSKDPSGKNIDNFEMNQKECLSQYHLSFTSIMAQFCNLNFGWRKNLANPLAFYWTGLKVDKIHFGKFQEVILYDTPYPIADFNTYYKIVEERDDVFAPEGGVTLSAKFADDVYEGDECVFMTAQGELHLLDCNNPTEEDRKKDIKFLCEELVEIIVWE